ncbi:efflux transporter outer membrane subunit [Chitinophaga sancti]|uniref:Efflux transporter outer membrane subunit n=1 Tax=Chitinophaga sancti TaxID=1004 RepID=A0A1K1PZG9_9BACT|nr:efflux transporter outer membrane subunit [Chitinophaga sancti]WQD61467.1 efflux transporter outer membrane subunit [Chitinophaga sancti]WQG92976.1 efflux transporter outer membrane subunit [Chitinophaga sancti]SFW53031.1 efflux transporter, outer membrane factor (OMF) lipoprotein, NodT family [Chitinophaga sancti]
MTSNNKQALLVILAAATFVASCKVTKPYRQAETAADSKLYRDSTSTDTTTMADLPWTQLFTDPHLQALIREGIANNLDLKVASARMNAAAANLRQSKQAFLPTVDATASVTQQKVAASQGGSFITANRTYQLYASASWELDVWGKLRSTKRAYMAAFLQSDAYRRAVLTQLIANIASNYYALLAYDEQLKITRQTVENRKTDVETMKTLKESDVVTGADVVQSEANRYAAEVTIPDLLQNIRETENTISVYLGRSPGAVERGVLSEQSVNADLKTGLPAQLLANRPDVQQAEYQLRYYYELTNVARTYFYPSLSITATGGLNGTSLDHYFDASHFFGSIVGSLTAPIFQQGQNKQRLRVAEANQQEYLVTYKKTLLTAGQEVTNALFDYNAAVDKAAIRGQQIAYLQKSVDYTKELLKYTSNTNYTDVLTSEQSLLSAQLNSISDKLQQLQAVVTLYRSLGGGWK